MTDPTYEELLEEARRRATDAAVPRWGAESAFETYRTRCQRFFAEVPEPPVYLRTEDPVRERARTLQEPALQLIAEGLVFSREAETAAEAALWVAALESALAMLLPLSAGRLKEAEDAFQLVRQRETEALKRRQMWARAEEGRAPVFDRASGTSRYDPRPEPHVNVKLACPAPACRVVGTYAFDSSGSSHRFVCATCQSPFIALFAETRRLEIASDRGGKRYHFEVDDVGGGTSLVDFEDGSGLEFAADRRDLLAFLYTEARELKGVLNLSSGRALWVQRFGPCFLASAVFGEEAEELSAFRAFRDDTLRRTRAGRAFIRAYYAHGPELARRVRARPWAHHLTRRALLEIHRWLTSPR